MTRSTAARLSPRASASSKALLSRRSRNCKTGCSATEDRADTEGGRERWLKFGNWIRTRSRIVSAAADNQCDSGCGHRRPQSARTGPRGRSPTKTLGIGIQGYGHPYARQVPFGVFYRDGKVGQGRLDFLVEDAVVLEIKAADTLYPLFTSQVISYLKATKLRLALLINSTSESSSTASAESLH